MAHYAFIDESNTVVEVIAGRDEGEGIDWESHYSQQRGLRCLRTSYRTLEGRHLAGGVPFRGNYSGIGYSYDESLDAFIPPRPEGDWRLDTETFSWVQNS